jgi:hypothetical protein
MNCAHCAHYFVLISSENHGRLLLDHLCSFVIMLSEENGGNSAILTSFSSLHHFMSNCPLCASSSSLCSLQLHAFLYRLQEWDCVSQKNHNCRFWLGREWANRVLIKSQFLVIRANWGENSQHEHSQQFFLSLFILTFYPSFPRSGRTWENCCKLTIENIKYSPFLCVRSDFPSYVIGMQKKDTGNLFKVKM